MRAEKRSDVYGNLNHAGEKRQKNCRCAKKKGRVNFIGRFVTGIIAVMLVMGLSFGCGSFFSSAHDNNREEPVEEAAVGEKYYKSVQIEKGDSLWSIAHRYMGTGYDSVYEYMDELADANHLKLSDLNHLQEGDYLVVAYYGDAQVH